MAGTQNPGVAEAAAAFETALDAESGPPVRESRRESRREERRETLDIDDMFPQRDYGPDRAGGDDGPEPDVVKKARRQARQEDDEDDEDPTPRRRAPLDDGDEDADPDLDEGEDAEDDGEDQDPDADEEGGEDQTGELDLSTIVTVTVDGQPKEVSLQEALQGYIRTDTFHNRLSQLQEITKTVESERNEVASARNYYGGMIQALKKQLDSLTPQEPDWDKLYAENPTEAASLERRWRTFKENRERLEREEARVAAEAKAEADRNFNAYAEAEYQKLLQAKPEWAKSQKTWDRDRKQMHRTARAVGYSDDEIKQLYDSRAVLILDMAARYYRMMQNKPRPVRTSQSALRPGAITSKRAAPNGLDRADRRLQRSGSVRDAAQAFEHMLDRE